MTTQTRDRESVIPDVVSLEPATRLGGDLRLPGDKSVSHRALMLALLGAGESTIRSAGDGADVRSTAAIARTLGARVERAAAGDAAGNVDYRVESPGVDALTAPAATLDCGNSGTSLRLYAGILAGQPFEATLDGDASLRGRPMGRIVEPLRTMGAAIGGPADGTRPPLVVRGRPPLTPLDWATPVPSAQVKSAILLAGLRADGTTRVTEAVATRDHTERMLRARGVAVRSQTRPGGGRVTEIDGGTAPRAHDETIPGDISAAAFWLVAGAAHPDAQLRLAGVGVNPTRRAVVDVLRRMGARIDELARDDGPDGQGEPLADLVVRSSALEAIELSPAETAAAIDEIPILCLAATQASGRTVVRGAGELRHKESDRIAGIVAGLRALGARVQNRGDDVVVDGPTPLRGATVDSLADHRLAMAFAVAALVAQGQTTIHGASSAAISYPAFFRDLERIRR